jgi:hypothetical protein
MNMSSWKRVIDHINLDALKSNALPLFAIVLWLIVCQPTSGQETLGEAVTSIEIQGQLMGNEAKPPVAQPKATPEANALQAQQDIEKLEKVAQKLMQSMQSGSYDRADFSQFWDTIVPKETNFSDGVNAILKPVFEKFGNAETLGKGKVVGPNKAVFPLQFTKGTVNMTLSIDQQDKIVEWTLTPAATVLAAVASASGAPVVVKTSPQAFANNLEPSLKEITVTFDQPMMDKSWSWTGEGETFPRMTAPPSYDQSRMTCTLPVSMEPGKVYLIGVNDEKFQNFKSAKGVPAKPYVILFATKSSDGKPTPIPEDMLKEAQAINEQSKVAVINRMKQVSPAADVTTDTQEPEINDLNAFKQELNRMDIEARAEENEWLGRLERKADLARAADEVVVAELRFLRKMAEAEGADKTVEAIDLVLKRRQERLAKLTAKLEEEMKEARQQQAAERRERRSSRAAERQPGRRTREAPAGEQQD